MAAHVEFEAEVAGGRERAELALESLSPVLVLMNLHVGFEIVLASTAEWAQWTLMAFETCVDHHMPLPVALPLDH